MLARERLLEVLDVLLKRHDHAREGARDLADLVPLVLREAVDDGPETTGGVALDEVEGLEPARRGRDAAQGLEEPRDHQEAEEAYHPGDEHDDARELERVGFGRALDPAHRHAGVQIPVQRLHVLD